MMANVEIACGQSIACKEGAMYEAYAHCYMHLESDPLVTFAMCLSY